MTLLMTNMERNVGQVFEEYLEEHIREKLIESTCEIEKYLNGSKKADSVEDLAKIVGEANKWIKATTRNYEDVYLAHEYHLFQGASGLYLAQGVEVKTNGDI